MTEHLRNFFRAGVERPWRTLLIVLAVNAGLEFIYQFTRAVLGIG